MAKEPYMSDGVVTGPYGKDSFVCQYHNRYNPKATGVWYGNDPFDDPSTLLMAQIIFIILLSRTLYFLLKPLHQGMLSAQLMAGIVISPTILRRYMVPQMDRLFPLGGKVTLQTISNIGFIFHFFVLGVKMDAGLLKSAGRRAVLIGVLGFFMPIALGGLTYLTANRFLTLDFPSASSIPLVVALNAISSFPVITSLLNDMKIINSEIGRLATSTAAVTDLCCWFTVISSSLFRYTKWKAVSSVVGILGFLIFIVFIFRPFIIWLTKHTPKGQPMKDSHFFLIVSIVMCLGIWSAFIGQYVAFGPLILGITLPSGPPLGTNLVQKLDTISTTLLLPVFITICAMRTNLLTGFGEGKSSVVVETVIIMGHLGKFTGTFLPALYCRLPFLEAVTLSLIMCTKGVIDVALYNRFREIQILDLQPFSLMLATMLILTGISRPLIKCLYDPSKRYMNHGRRTILQSKDNTQLKILVCVYHEDNVPVVLNLLEASNFSFFTPASIFVLHLMELTGRATSILVPYHHLDHFTSNTASADHIVNAFSNFEQQHQESVLVKHFTAVAPYVTMHDDICSLSLDKRAAIVIIPYHKQWGIDGKFRSTIPAIKAVNNNVIKKAPCSVGILVDGEKSGGNRYILTPRSPYRIGLLYFGGADDWEALAYCRRMAEHPYVNLTVIRFIHVNEIQEKETHFENEFIYEFKTKAATSGSKHYKEKIVKDGLETTWAIHSMEDDFDLVIVGMYHEPNSPLTSGLTTDTEWSECPELGVIGDMLASSNSRFSILVVQQQPVLIDNNIN